MCFHTYIWKKSNNNPNLKFSNWIHLSKNNSDFTYLNKVLWWGFVLRNQRVGTDDWTRFQREVGPTIAPFPRRIPNSSCFCLTRSIYQACTFGGWAQPWPFKIHIIAFTLGSGLARPKYDPITLAPLPNPSTNFILCQALMRATIVVENM